MVVWRGKVHPSESPLFCRDCLRNCQCSQYKLHDGLGIARRCLCHLRLWVVDSTCNSDFDSRYLASSPIRTTSGTCLEWLMLLHYSKCASPATLSSAHHITHDPIAFNFIKECSRDMPVMFVTPPGTRGCSPTSRGFRNWLLLKWWVQNLTKNQPKCYPMCQVKPHMWNLLNQAIKLPYQTQRWLSDVHDAPSK
jgi:hypothetical protein